jgi:transposase
MSKKLKLNDITTYTVIPNQDHVPEEERTYFRLLSHPQYTDTTLIATYSPSRAHKDQEDRNRLLAKLRKKIENSSEEATIKNVISNGGYKKYTTVKAGSLITINEEAVQADALWDGFHGIAVANSAKLSPEMALSRYRDLWHVEEAFRIAKSTLKTRPIFHWAPHRIEAHMLLCFINLFLERFLELLLRKNDTPLTPDRIRYALSQIHTTTFEDESTGHEAMMSSVLVEDAQKIYQTLGLSIERTTVLRN